MNITIRNATPQDGAALLEIERRSFSTPFWDLRSLLGYECIVADSDSLVVGFLISRELVPSFEDVPPEREILNLAVAPEFRRQGVASALLEFECAGAATHFLEVRESNAPAQELYRKFGFQEVGRRPDYYVSPDETAIVMRRK